MKNDDLHSILTVRFCLDEYFPRSFIDKRGSIEWPGRFRDLTPNDIFLWGHLKSKMYGTQPDNFEILRQRISQERRILRYLQM